MNTPTPTPTRTPLSLLAEFGPLTRECIASALDVPWFAVVEHVASLHHQGLVTKASPTRWEVTDAGRVLASKLSGLEGEVAAARRRDAACQGVQG